LIGGGREKIGVFAQFLRILFYYIFCNFFLYISFIFHIVSQIVIQSVSELVDIKASIANNMQFDRLSRDRSNKVATTALLFVVLTGVIIISSAVGGGRRVRVAMAFAASSPSSSSSTFQQKYKANKNNKEVKNNEQIITMLQSPHPIYSPIEKLEQTIEDCKKLGITDWDIYGDFDKQAGGSASSSSFLRSFENEISYEFGKEDGVFMPSGGMAQSIALLIHSNNQTTNSNTNSNDDHDHDDHDEKNSERESKEKKKKRFFICHKTSHLLLHEQDGYRELCGLDAISLPNNDIGLGLGASPLLYQHVQDYFEKQDQEQQNIDNNVKESMISTIMLELPHRELGGKITPWDDIIQLRNFATTRDIKLHCDGARIFEATTATGYQKSSSLAELVDPFDSVYISFYKGLGGMSGAMLLGSKEFCDEARIWLRRFGGNLYTLLPYAVSGWAGYKRHWKDIIITNSDDDYNDNEQQPMMMSFQDKKDKLVHIVKELSSSSKNIINNTNNQKQSILLFEPSIPEVNMVHCYLQPSKEMCEIIRDEIINEYNGISIFHRLRSIEEEEDGSVDYVAFQKGYRCKFELSIGEANGNIPNKIWIQAWSAFFNNVTLLSAGS
jgi:threonine aldolase